MKWAQQRNLVESLADRAQFKKRESRRIRANLHDWATSSLGSAETLAWLFAAGSFWASCRSSAPERSATRRSMIAALNTSFFGWQLFHRQLKLSQPMPGNPPDEPQ